MTFPLDIYLLATEPEIYATPPPPYMWSLLTVLTAVQIDLVLDRSPAVNHPAPPCKAMLNVLTVLTVMTALTLMAVVIIHKELSNRNCPKRINSM